MRFKMDNYYKILEINQEATPHEIKRAYFNKVKKHTPETDPIAFEKIRTAYEVLKNPHDKRNYDQLLSHSFGDSDPKLNEIKRLINDKQLAPTLILLEDFLEQTPDSLEGILLKSDILLKQGSSGKAVKLLETVRDTFNDSQIFLLSLAKAYSKRGFNNKANQCFVDAIEIDRTNPTVWSKYLRSILENDSFDFTSRFNDAVSINEDIFLSNDYELYLYATFEEIARHARYNLFYSVDENKAPISENTRGSLKKYISVVSEIGSLPDDEQVLMAVISIMVYLLETEDFTLLDSLFPFFENTNYSYPHVTNNVESIRSKRKIIAIDKDKKISEGLFSYIAYTLDPITTPECDCKDCYSREEWADETMSFLGLKFEILNTPKKYEK